MDKNIGKKVHFCNCHDIINIDWQNLCLFDSKNCRDRQKYLKNEKKKETTKACRLPSISLAKITKCRQSANDQFRLGWFSDKTLEFLAEIHRERCKVLFDDSEFSSSSSRYRQGIFFAWLLFALRVLSSRSLSETRFTEEPLRRWIRLDSSVKSSGSLLRTYAITKIQCYLPFVRWFTRNWSSRFFDHPTICYLLFSISRYFRLGFFLSYKAGQISEYRIRNPVR